MFNHDRFGMDMMTGSASKPGDRHAPHTLAREAPVWPVFNHPEDPITAITRNPSDTFNLRQGLPPQLVGLHRHKPLLGRTKDHRTLAPPTVRIGMVQRAVPEQTSVRIEILDNLWIRLKNVLT